jgi:coenzyme F420-reducing hydrogenase delta subunit
MVESVTGQFQLLLFSTNTRFIARAAAAGVDGIIVDWEQRGKAARQAGADTQINRDTVDDLRRVRAATAVRLLCRINGYGATTASEVEQAIAAGADEILLPMVRTAAEVDEVLALVAGRCGVGILVETEEAVGLAPELARLPLTRAYAGLNDLAIQRGTANIFAAVADGTVERVRRAFRVPFGFGGLTRPERGWPIPCRLLIGEMARLGCDFGFLRRSFLADVAEAELEREVPRLRQALAAACERTPQQVARDQADLHARIIEIGDLAI